MWHAIGRTALAHCQHLLPGFLQDGSFPCGAVRTVKDSVDLLRQAWVATGDRLFPPLVTRGTFLRPMHRDDPSCRAAVARLNATRVAQGLEPCSPLTGGDCKARQRLPETLRHRLVPLSGQRLQPQVPTAWHWHGRAVKRVEGSGVSRPDTAANPQDAPQPGSQAPGVGCPVARSVVVLSWACGAVLAAAVGRLQGQQTRELRLLHRLHASRAYHDVVWAERFSGSDWEVA